MAEQKKSRDNDKSSRRPPEFRMPPRTWVVWIAILGFTVVLLTLKNRVAHEVKPLSHHAFLQLVARQEDPDTLFFNRELLIEGDTELGLVVKNMLDAVEWPKLPCFPGMPAVHH